MGGPKPGCSDIVRAGIIESHNVFVLGPILVKFHIRTGLIESFQRSFGRGGAPKKNCRSSSGALSSSLEQNFCFQAKNKKAVIFYLLANPAETAYLSARDG